MSGGRRCGPRDVRVVFDTCSTVRQLPGVVGLTTPPNYFEGLQQSIRIHDRPKSVPLPAVLKGADWSRCHAAKVSGDDPFHPLTDSSSASTFAVADTKQLLVGFQCGALGRSRS